MHYTLYILYAYTPLTLDKKTKHPLTFGFCVKGYHWSNDSVVETGTYQFQLQLAMMET